MKKTFLSCCLILGFGAGCSKPALQTSAPPPEDALAEIGGAAITRRDFALEIERRGRRPASESERAEWLAEIVRRETLFANARANGLDQDLEIQLAFKKMVVGKYLASHSANPSAAISPQEIENYYRANLEQFAQPERARFAVIFLKLSSKATPEKHAEMLARAERVRQSAVSQMNFTALVEQFSEDNGTRYQGGDAGFLTAGLQSARWPSSVIQSVFGLRKPGEISGVVSGDDGLYILKLIQREEASTRPLVEVEPIIRRRLSEAAARKSEEEFMAAESARAGVVLHSEALERIPIAPAQLAQQAVPPAAPQ